MSATLYKIINPIVKIILSSPFHSVMSSNTALLHFKGRKSGKGYVTPVSYHIHDGSVHCFTNKKFSWWKNLSSEIKVSLTLKGKVVSGLPVLTEGDSEDIKFALRDFLIAVPRDASHSGVKLDEKGNPSLKDIERAVQHMLHISIPVTAI